MVWFVVIAAWVILGVALRACTDHQATARERRDSHAPGAGRPEDRAIRRGRQPRFVRSWQ